MSIFHKYTKEEKEQREIEQVRTKIPKVRNWDAVLKGVELTPSLIVPPVDSGLYPLIRSQLRRRK